MPVTEKKYLDWVQKHRTKGTTVRKKGDAYYLYKRTSWCVQGKNTRSRLILIDDWENVLSIIILKCSSTSYIQRNRVIKKDSDFQYQFAAQTDSLSRRIYREWSVRLEELRRSETIYLICLEVIKTRNGYEIFSRRFQESIRETTLFPPGCH